MRTTNMYTTSVVTCDDPDITSLSLHSSRRILNRSPIDVAMASVHAAITFVWLTSERLADYAFYAMPVLLVAHALLHLCAYWSLSFDVAVNYRTHASLSDAVTRVRVVPRATVGAPTLCTLVRPGKDGGGGGGGGGGVKSIDVPAIVVDDDDDGASAAVSMLGTATLRDGKAAAQRVHFVFQMSKYLFTPSHATSTSSASAAASKSVESSGDDVGGVVGVFSPLAYPSALSVSSYVCATGLPDTHSEPLKAHRRLYGDNVFDSES
jgi:hypothetical protein